MAISEMDFEYKFLAIEKNMEFAQMKLNSSNGFLPSKVRTSLLKDPARVELISSDLKKSKS